MRSPSGDGMAVEGKLANLESDLIELREEVGATVTMIALEELLILLAEEIRN